MEAPWSRSPAGPCTGACCSGPAREHLSPEAYRERVAKMGLEIEEEAAVIRKRTGAHPFGAAKILAQHPWTRPERVKKSPAPLLHAASKAVRQIFYKASPSSSPPTARPPRSSREEIPARASLWAASRRRCRSWAGSRPDAAVSA